MTESADRFAGQQIQRLRESIGLLQAQFAELLRAEGVNWSQATLSKVERGERSVRLHEAPSVAKLLRVDIGDLLPGGAMLQSVRARVEWELKRAAEEMATAEFHQRMSSNALTSVRLMEALRDGQPGPFVVHCKRRGFFFGISDQYSPIALSMEQFLILLGVSYELVEVAKVEAALEAETWAPGQPFPYWYEHEFPEGIGAESYKIDMQWQRLTALFSEKFPQVTFASEQYDDDFESRLLIIEGLEPE